ncbi:hypothetical protein [Streptosporangium carneum]|uniref:Uncharacterized protein n=1 Tax=Streptosporangium carneum TaxID=47481 RepID=A0A9W6MGI8_9ACTN|nr:hypothetical protein [Streptosporangium carneum]GLK12973.1 hypothetical protein GCM10017600_63830 [Streptosporangium carneum]
MKRLDLWSHEIRRAGPTALLGPPALVVLAVLLAAFGTRIGSREGNTARFLVAFVEMGIPLLTGLLAASLVGRDRAVELRLALPSAYRATLLRRLAVTVGWAGVCALAISALLTAGGWWERLPLSPGGVAGQLAWLSPTLWLTALGLLAYAASRTTVAATATVALVWVVEQALSEALRDNPASRWLYLFATTRGVADGDWLPNRLVLLATALPLAVAAWFLLGDVERFLGGEDE